MITRLLVHITAWLVFMAVLLFGAAGTLHWAGGWWFLLELGVLGLWIGLWLARSDPALLDERLKPLVQRQQSRWDRIFMACTGVVWVGWTVLMGLDAGRFHWSAMPVWLSVLGAVGIFLCHYACLYVFRANSFAAPVVKIQSDRGHTVSDAGPYAYVRHPMYAAAILFLAGTPLLLASWWGLVCVPLLIAGLGYRAVREERMLAAQLKGYAEYATRVRYRFVPYIW